MKSFNAIVVAFCISVLLTSCGGSSWSPTATPIQPPQTITYPPARTDPIIASTLSFPLAVGMQESSKFASYTTYIVYGYCSGTSTSSNSDAFSTTFEGAAASGVSSTETLSLTNCMPGYLSASGTTYFDSNFLPLGSSNSNGEYALYLTPPTVPASVVVGDTGTIGTKTVYSDNTKTTTVGQDVLTYVIEPDTANTAIVDLITTSYGTSNRLLATTHSRYRITPSGYMTQISSDTSGAGIQLILVANPDVISPSVSSHEPSNTNNPYTPISPLINTITATFSEPLDAATVNVNTFKLVSEVGGAIAGTVSCSGKTATFTLATPVVYTGNYTATLTTGVKDWAGNALGSDYSWTFSVDLSAPTVASTIPANLATKLQFLPNDPLIQATFNEYVSPLTNAEFTLMNGSIPVAGSVRSYESMGYPGTFAQFTPLQPLLPNTTYTATITTGVSDITGNHLAANYSWSFTTENVQFKAAVHTPYLVGGNAVATGDINGDGMNDVVMTSWDYPGTFLPTPLPLYVVKQSSIGVLDPPISYITHGTGNCLSESVAMADMNHDGKNDVVVGNSSCGIEVLLQNANGGLDPGVVYASTDAVKIRIADLNGDGWSDVVGVGAGTNTVTVWMQNAGGGLNAPVIYNVNHAGGEDIDVGDVNNDGLKDIVVLDGLANSQIAVLTQSAGVFGSPTYYSVGTLGAGGIAVGDVNSDGKNDVSVSYRVAATDDRLGVFYQNVSKTLDPVVTQPTSLYHLGTTMSGVKIVDITGDGRNDVLLQGFPGDMWLFEQLSDNSLNYQRWYPAPYGRKNPQNFAVGDMNSDGKPDVVFGGGGLELIYHY